MPKQQPEPAADGAAVEVARAAAVDVAGADKVGELLGSQDEADVLGTLTSIRFESLQSGYVGWFWSVSVSDIDGAVSVNDVVLLPGDDAIVAPDWTPYRERIRPGDLGPGDLLPPEDDDLRLVPAWSAGDSMDTVDRYFAREIGLGRTRVLSLVGRDLAADRWHDGPQGPDNPIAEQAPGTCSTCGFLISLAGPLSDEFGVCANADANADGRAVALTHGCGAHSAAKLKRSAAPADLPPAVLDTMAIDPLDLAADVESADPEVDDDAAAEAEVAATEEAAAVTPDADTDTDADTDAGVIEVDVDVDADEAAADIDGTDIVAEVDDGVITDEADDQVDSPESAAD